MSDETAKKPSELAMPLAQLLMPAYRAAMRAQSGLSAEEFEAFLSTDAGAPFEPICNTLAVTGAILRLMDSEAERRSAWEAKMESELAEHKKALASLALFRQTALALFPDLRVLQPRHEVVDADEFTWVGNKTPAEGDGKPSL